MGGGMMDLRDGFVFPEGPAPNALRSRDYLGLRQPPMMPGIGMGGLGSRSPAASLRSGSSFSLEHLDRQPRTYHYQPPFVEDYESEVEEELLRREEEEMIQQLYGLPYDFEDQHPRSRL
jgi:hypothetical protein